VTTQVTRRPWRAHNEVKDIRGKFTQGTQRGSTGCSAVARTSADSSLQRGSVVRRRKDLGDIHPIPQPLVTRRDRHE